MAGGEGCWSPGRPALQERGPTGALVFSRRAQPYEAEAWQEDYGEQGDSSCFPAAFLPAPPISQTQTEAKGKRAQWLQSMLHQPRKAQSGEEWSVDLWRLVE